MMVMVMFRRRYTRRHLLEVQEKKIGGRLPSDRPALRSTPPEEQRIIRVRRSPVEAARKELIMLPQNFMR